MKFKVGDKVRVREDLKEGMELEGNNVIEEMEKFAGKIVTISRIYGFSYELKEDRSCWSWTDEMLEPIEPTTAVHEPVNYIEQVAKMLGVEIGEEFDIDGSCCNQFHFNKIRLQDEDGASRSEALGEILCGNYKIIKKPFVPKEGEIFYKIDSDGSVEGTKQRYLSDDFALIAFGNCFRTTEEAERNKSTMLAKMEEYKK